MILLRFHLDVTDPADSTWWIDSPNVPSLYAAGTTIINARQRAMDALDAAGIDIDEVHYELVNS